MTGRNLFTVVAAALVTIVLFALVGAAVWLLNGNRLTVTVGTSSASTPPASPAGLAITSTLAATPAPEVCYLGYPNSSATVVYQLTGPGANAVCNDLTNPIRNSYYLKNTKALSANTWAPKEICTFTKYGMTFTIWDVPSRSHDCSSLQSSI